MIVRAEMATLWTSPDAPRPVDAPALADVPDLGAWGRRLDDEARRDLLGRTLTQGLRGEPVEVLERHDDWTRVALAWQPGADGTGYRGWIRSAHLKDGEAVVPAVEETDLVTVVRRLLGTPYLWGGCGPRGIDCSGLVHVGLRLLGIRVPRDAADQQAALPRLERADVVPGDLLFFSSDGRGTTHVGVASEPVGTAMVQASERSSVVEEAPLDPSRHATYVGAARAIHLDAERK